MDKGTEILKVRKGRKFYICTSLLTTGTLSSYKIQTKIQVDLKINRNSALDLKLN